MSRRRPYEPERLVTIAPPTLPTWQYLSTECYADQLQDHANQMGRDGWEIAWAREDKKADRRDGHSGVWRVCYLLWKRPTPLPALPPTPPSA